MLLHINIYISSIELSQYSLPCQLTNEKSNNARPTLYIEALYARERLNDNNEALHVVLQHICSLRPGKPAEA